MKLPMRYRRSYSTLKQALPAKAVRSRFLDYFVNENGHQFVKSSSVLPHFDYSIPFVHSGMCQVLLEALMSPLILLFIIMRQI